MRSEEWWKGRTIHITPQYPLFLYSKRLEVSVYCYPFTNIGEHIEMDSELYEMIRIRVIRWARRPSLLTSNS